MRGGKGKKERKREVRGKERGRGERGEGVKGR